MSPKEPETLLATPNWPEGMTPSSTVSWVVSLPRQHSAELRFFNVSQPKCLERHTALTVMLLERRKEILRRREDQDRDYDLTVPESFYLNMSNCDPQEGQFRAMAKIILQKEPSKLLLLAKC